MSCSGPCPIRTEDMIFITSSRKPRRLDHPNAQARLKAATATLAIAPMEAREVLERIQRLKEFPQAGEAGMRLWNIDRGVFKPT